MKHGWISVALCAAGPLLAQDIYGGPAVLNRGPMGRLTDSSDLLVLRPSLQLLGSYDKGLYLFGTDAAGRPVAKDSYGVSALADVSGYHRWRHTLLGLGYRGSFRHYTGNTYQDGIDQNLTLNVQHQAGPRTLVSLTGVGGSYSRGYGLGSGTVYDFNYGDYSQGADPTVALVSGTDPLDARTYYAGGGADVVYQMSRRVSLRAGGTAFAVRRRSRGLIELNGYNARGDLTYRVGRRSNLSLEYQYLDFRFVRSFGDSTGHIGALNYSWQLARNWTFALRAGGFRIESLRAEFVALDPAVAAILGQGSGIEAVYRVNFGSVAGVALSRNFRRAGLAFRYDRGITPGSSLFLTSRADAVSGVFNYRGWKRWSMSLLASYSTYSPILQDYGTFRMQMATASLSYRAGRSVHLVGHASQRYFELSRAPGLRGRNSYQLLLGIGFAPGEVPISFH